MESSKTIRILYIEDDQGLARLFQKKLEKSGYLVDIAIDGREGLAVFESGSYDIVFVDQAMPVYEGLEVIRIMTLQGLQVPIVMITGTGDEETAVKAMKLGASDYIIKDVDGYYLELLPSVIEEVLYKKRLSEEKMQTEKALKESLERFKKLTEASFDGILIIDKGIIVEINTACAEMFGYEPDELVGKKATGLVAPESREEVRRNIIANYEKHYEAIALRKDGSRFDVIAYGAIVIYNGRPVRMTAIHDITERKLLENNILESQKMKAISSLAGGIAHKFNNSLNVITGNIELLKMASPDIKDIDKYSDRMFASVRDMANLTSYLLAYAEGGKYQPRTLSLTDFIDNTLSIINQKIASAIQVDTDIPVNIFNIKGDQIQIQMLLSAIIMNAAEAIENKGCIKIIIRNKVVNEKIAKKYLGLKTGSYVCLRVIDDGKGMDEETKHRIFEPFFTTNFQGRGLGMAAAYGIVKNHDGWIGVDSDPGKGTDIRIYLPAVDVQVKKTEKPKAEMFQGTGTILLIEDEEMVMDVGRAMLEKLGYSVLAAKCGKDAIDIARTFKGNIDLALLDMGLPDMGGKELYPLLMETRSIMKVIVCSGYSIDGPARDVLSAGAQAFIHKPFLFAELSAKLKQTIERRKHKRFKVKKDAVAILKSNPSQQGKIIDISEGGLAFRYSESGDRSIRLNESDELIINLAEEGFYLDNMPGKTISDFTLADDAHLGSMVMKRRGIQFGDLSPNQTDQLDYFIEDHTIAG